MEDVSVYSIYEKFEVGLTYSKVKSKTDILRLI